MISDNLVKDMAEWIRNGPGYCRRAEIRFSAHGVEVVGGLEWDGALYRKSLIVTWVEFVSANFDLLAVRWESVKAELAACGKGKSA